MSLESYIVDIHFLWSIFLLSNSIQFEFQSEGYLIFQRSNVTWKHEGKHKANSLTPQMFLVNFYILVFFFLDEILNFDAISIEITIGVNDLLSENFLCSCWGPLINIPNGKFFFLAIRMKRLRCVRRQTISNYIY